MKTTGFTRRNTYIGLLSLFLALSTVAFFALDTNTTPEEAAAHFTPAATVVNAGASIAFYEDRLRRAPDDLSSKLSLAQIYLQEARLTRQEASLIPKAEDLLEDILDEQPDQYHARALQASLYNVLHRFERGRDIARQLLDEDEAHAYVYGILVDALVELGEYEAAVAACDRMIALRPGISSYSRAAYLRELHGDTDGALEAMTLAAEAGVIGDADRSWTLYQIGQLYLAKNDLETAEKIFEGILDEQPGYAFATGGLAQVALIEESYYDALALFQNAYFTMPDDRFLEGQIEVYALLGDEKERHRVERLLEESYQAAADMGENVRMEYADYLADLDKDLEEALELAEVEYKHRPDHLHALETYAWTLHKNGRSDEAMPYIERAMRLNTGDAMVYYRAGNIYEAAGHPERAREQFEMALAANLHVESVSAALDAERRQRGM